MRILNIVGARPNFMKVAPVHKAFVAHGHDAILVHTGQHYDENMSRVFFEELGMPKPDVNLEVGSGSHAQQTARIIQAFEAVLLKEKPDMVLVAGDVNSTIACALDAVKLGIPVAHLEAGLRSFDRTMPEEINRVLTDSISSYLLTPSVDGDINLKNEGIAAEKIFRVGNAMIDSLHAHLQRATALNMPQRLQLDAQGYALLTLHRPANVDNEAVLRGLLGVVFKLSERVPVLFPLHPRTKKQAERFGLLGDIESKLRVLDPMGYLEFLSLQKEAKLMLTDSGGIQEESTCLGVPCLTLRENTERPITVEQGTNTIVGVNPEIIQPAIDDIFDSGGKKGRIPELWDGHTAERVVAALTT